MKHSHIIKLVYSSLFAALVLVGTQFIKVPIPFGYFNLGDPFVLLSGYFVGGAYGIAAAAIGSGLADLLSGYVIYAPATVLIKSAMSALVFLICRRFATQAAAKKYLPFLISATIAEAVMVMGYYLYDAILYGFASALVSLPGNLLQGAAAVIVSTIIILLLNKTKMLEHFEIK